MYKRILVALDGSGAGELALPHAVALARAFTAELILLRVVLGTRPVPDVLGTTGAEGAPPPSSVDVQSLTAEQREAESYLDTVIARIAAPDLTVTRRVHIGPVARTIADEAIVTQADLLVLATRGRGGLARLMLGSVAEEVLRTAPCPAFLVPVTTPSRPPEVLPPSGQVRSFEDDARAVGALAPKPVGLRTIDVRRIVGSVGRARELNPDFRPPFRAQRRGDDERFEGIVRALDRGEVLPPIEVYKLGYHYYVLDGNHRVAAAKARHQRDIDAVVTEFLPVSSEEGAKVFSERRDFERATGLTRVGASRVGHYPRLEQIIREYAEGQPDLSSPLAPRLGDLRETARHWYYSVFRPVAVAIRQARLYRCFPSERTADIFVHLADFREEQQALYDESLTWEEALRRFADHYADCAGNVWRRIPGLRRLLRPRLPSSVGTEGCRAVLRWARPGEAVWWSLAR